MNKKFDAIEFQQQQRTKLSTKISKMSDEAILEFLNPKSSYEDMETGSDPN